MAVLGFKTRSAWFQRPDLSRILCQEQRQNPHTHCLSASFAKYSGLPRNMGVNSTVYFPPALCWLGQKDTQPPSCPPDASLARPPFPVQDSHLAHHALGNQKDVSDCQWVCESGCQIGSPLPCNTRSKEWENPRSSLTSNKEENLAERFYHKPPHHPPRPQVYCSTFLSKQTHFLGLQRDTDVWAAAPSMGHCHLQGLRQ